MNIAEEHCDVLILGAGAAGIGAARRLLGADEVDVEGTKSKSSYNVIILEARDRVGGRAWTSDSLQCRLELDHGGKWIHGSTSRENVMPQLASRCNVPTSNDSKSLASRVGALLLQKKRRRRGDIKRVLLESGNSNERKMQSVVPDRKAENAAKILYKQLCEIEGKGSLIAPLKATLPIEASYKDAILEVAQRELPNEPFEKWLEMIAQKAIKAKKNPRLVQETIALLRHQIYWRLESYEGARLDQCSLRYAMAGYILPGPNAEVEGGYGNLVKKLASSIPIDIRRRHRVISIDRSKSNEEQQVLQVVVTVECRNDDGTKYQKRFIARKGCIVALPLGVLQQSTPLGPEFVPPLPEELMGAIGRLALCVMNKVEILFPHRWWTKGTGGLAIASEYTSDTASGDNFPLGNMPWAHWVVEEDNPAILVCYATGVFAERIETMTADNVQSEAVDALRDAFDSAKGFTSIPNPVKINVTKWRSDPSARGSWTFFKAGTKGEPDVRTFQNFNQEYGSIEKIYFAGEHTCDGSVSGLDIGTVHGAYLSGRLAAEELLESLDTYGASSQKRHE